MISWQHLAHHIICLTKQSLLSRGAVSDLESRSSEHFSLAKEQLVYYIILILFPLLIPVTWLRQLKYFAVSNAIASFLVSGFYFVLLQ